MSTVVQRAFTIDPMVELAKVPGLGPGLAERVVRELGIQTLEQLEMAAHSGRLQIVRGVGAGRARQVRRGVAEMLAARGKSLPANDDHARRGPASTRPPPPPSPDAPDTRSRSIEGSEPSVGEILEIDREYRRRARAEALPRVAPRRFNPHHEAFLPIYEVDWRGTRYTAFYSNSPSAHALGKTEDWVIVLARRLDARYQYTVVSETRGRWRGQRVVRGREGECRTFYGLQAA